ncbi:MULTISPECIES: hypothetical protein [Streptomyces]|uniref:hypothetical protein n=1 Tax=Streptomyces TaxID=1883 RepID=UPI00163BE322|nr:MULTISPECIES: hypothetical protein [Streptomyces]MBC2875311.1 hypothetical protein [Streptomyces sp. TYQ1024]UBI37134.1 hypothetical protein K7I03_12105 [Streptomyces mobaraensis]UKW29729.1 hypothetical protein MCU78_12080 [Streptomyces sp. TYQ1024]
MTEAQSSARASARAGRSHGGVIHLRHRHTSHFTVVGNHLPQHRELSLVAIGIGVYVQSLPDGVHVGIKDLARRFREGEVVIGRGLRELEAVGYLERRRVRTEGGQVVTVTRWNEHPRAAARELRRPGPGRAVGSMGTAGVIGRRPPAPFPSAPDVERPDAGGVSPGTRRPVSSGRGGQGGRGRSGEAGVGGAWVRALPDGRPGETVPAPGGAPGHAPADRAEREAGGPDGGESSADRPGRRPDTCPRTAPTPLPTADAPADQPAADVLAVLRRYDPRLLLSADDVRELTPAVRAWLDRGVGPVHVVRALTADLPVGRIARPVRLLRHRLVRGLPPALPDGPLRPSPPERAAPKPLPLRTCDGCERAIRAAHPGALCRDCREEAVTLPAVERPDQRGQITA